MTHFLSFVIYLLQHLFTLKIMKEKQRNILSVFYYVTFEKMWSINAYEENVVKTNKLKLENKSYSLYSLRICAKIQTELFMKSRKIRPSADNEPQSYIFN